MEKKKTNIKFLIITVSLLVLGTIYGIYKYNHAQSHEETDDAQIEKNMTPIIPRVAGYISKVYVKDNAVVKKGDTLFTIDKKDFQVKIEAAKAALIGAAGGFDVANSDIGSALASISVSEAHVLSAGGNIE